MAVGARGSDPLCRRLAPGRPGVPGLGRDMAAGAQKTSLDRGYAGVFPGDKQAAVWGRDVAL